MRGLGVSIVALAGACKFSGPEGTRDGAIDAPADVAIDGPSPERKKLITIDPAKVYADLTAFPVWIVLNDNDVKALALADGSDIHFTRTDGSALEYEIQRWKKDTGHLEAWVRVELQDASPTMLEIRYGDPSRKHPPDSKLVFSNGFEAVWHLDDALSNTTVADAVQSRNGTAMGLGPTDQVPARLGGGISFDDAAKRIAFMNPYSGGGPHTISAWVDQNMTNNCDSIVTMGNPMDRQSRWFHSFHPQDSKASVGFFAEDWFDAANMDIRNIGLTLVHWTYENGVSRLYRGGVQRDTHTHGAGTINTQGTMGFLGYAPAEWAGGPPNTCALKGVLDEVRLANVARTPEWIATEFENQSSPQTFYMVGPEQRSP